METTYRLSQTGKEVQALLDQVTPNKEAIAQETTDREQSVTEEQTRAEGAEQQLQESIDAEQQARIDDVAGELLAGERMLLGNEHSRVIVTGGNVRLFPENQQTPVSPDGLPLHCETPAGNRFEAEFHDKRESWTYVADRNEDGHLFVWVP